ncbi:MAG: hypothetical protein WAO58_08060, partial [Fimbriimonadaceae bacterium]
SPITWTKIDSMSYLNTTNRKYSVNVFNNFTGAHQNVAPNWQATVWWTQKVEGSSNTGPSWTAKFIPLNNSPLGILYFGGGESVPAEKKRTDYVPFVYESGLEYWMNDEDPPDVVYRSRNWETPGSKVFRLTDLAQGGGGGG